MSDLILTTGDVARRLNLSSEYIRRLTREGKLKAKRTASGQHLYEASEIERLKAERELQRQEKAALAASK